MFALNSSLMNYIPKLPIDQEFNSKWPFPDHGCYVEALVGFSLPGIYRRLTCQSQDRTLCFILYRHFV